VTGELKSPFQDNKAILPEGKAVYDKECAQCHGADLTGNIGPSLADIDKSDADLFKSIYSGIPAGGMPAFGDNLGKDRVWRVVTYVKSSQRH